MRDPLPGEPTDAVLAARAGADPEAFAELYRRYFDAVYWLCLGRLRDAPAAEDATAEVFVRALAALPRFRARGGGFRPWLFRIARNAVVDTVRARRPQVPFEEGPDLVDAAPTPEDAAVVGDGRRALWAAMARLPPDQRRVVELRLAGLTGAEIAQVLGKSVASIKMLQLRAMARLRRSLKAETDEQTPRVDR